MKKIEKLILLYSLKMFAQKSFQRNVLQSRSPFLMQTRTRLKPENVFFNTLKTNPTTMSYDQIIADRKEYAMQKMKVRKLREQMKHQWQKGINDNNEDFCDEQSASDEH